MSSSLIGGGGGRCDEGTCLCLIVVDEDALVDDCAMSGVLIDVGDFFLLFVANTGRMYLVVRDLAHLGKRHCLMGAVMSYNAPTANPQTEGMIEDDALDSKSCCWMV